MFCVGRVLSDDEDGTAPTPTPKPSYRERNYYFDFFFFFERTTQRQAQYISYCSESMFRIPVYMHCVGGPQRRRGRHTFRRQRQHPLPSHQLGQRTRRVLHTRRQRFTRSCQCRHSMSVRLLAGVRVGLGAHTDVPDGLSTEVDIVFECGACVRCERCFLCVCVYSVFPPSSQLESRCGLRFASFSNEASTLYRESGVSLIGSVSLCLVVARILTS